MASYESNVALGTRKRPPPPAVVPAEHQHRDGTPSSQEHPVWNPPPSKKPAVHSSSRNGGIQIGSSPPGSSSKPYKGLRHFSMMVCKKVEEKGVTTYNEVADELVRHVVKERRKEDPSSKFDEKNIRRRVYDALNVLMAMDIITKEKKEISWKGLPTSTHADLDMLQRDKEYLRQEVESKREALRELLVQQVCFRNLVAHNASDPSAGEEQNKDHKIPLPFIVVNTQSSAVIQCNMSRDLTDVMFDFSQPFEINDDNTILKRLGMHKTNLETLQEMLPEDLLEYAEQQGMLTNVLGVDTSATEPSGPEQTTSGGSAPGVTATSESANECAASTD